MKKLLKSISAYENYPVRVAGVDLHSDGSMVFYINEQDIEMDIVKTRELYEALKQYFKDK